jgi:Fe-S-cluster-containing hydrogenase component 2
MNIDVTPILGIKDHLRRTKDKPCNTCASTTAIVREGTATHAASLRCFGCGKFRGWAPAELVKFWVGIANALSHRPQPHEPRRGAGRSRRACVRARHRRRPFVYDRHSFASEKADAFEALAATVKGIIS